MNRLWFAVAVLAALDATITCQVFDFIHYSADWRCGTGACWASTKVTFFSVLSLPLAFYVVWTYLSLRAEMSPILRFAARLPLVCLAGLLLAFFVVFRFSCPGPLICV
jgi:hypothetical protein